MQGRVQFNREAMIMKNVEVIQKYFSKVGYCSEVCWQIKSLDIQKRRRTSCLRPAFPKSQVISRVYNPYADKDKKAIFKINRRWDIVENHKILEIGAKSNNIGNSNGGCQSSTIGLHHYRFIKACRTGFQVLQERGSSSYYKLRIQHLPI